MYLSLPRLSRERKKVTGVRGAARQRILAIGGVVRLPKRRVRGRAGRPRLMAGALRRGHDDCDDIVMVGAAIRRLPGA